MTRAQEEAIAAVEGAFGRLIKDVHVGERWITWRSIHKLSALTARVAEAQRRGARAVFARSNGPVGGNCVGCLNPEAP
jgi:hypothetical protein